MAEKSQTGVLDTSSIWAVEKRFRSLVVLLLLATLLTVVYLSRESAKEVVINTGTTAASNSEVTTPRNSTKTEECDLFSGMWVFDNISYPLYQEKECKYMSDQLACIKYGRKDLKYQHYRWQPHGCDLPRFNASMLLDQLRNKRLVYVGDSLNRGQWVSMVCLVESAISPARKSFSYHHNNSLIVFQVSDYNASIEFYWAPLLVESNSDDPFNHRLPDRIVRIQAIEKHARHWSDADVLVFNSYLWWRRPEMKLLWGSFEAGDGLYKDVLMPRAYEMALQTWSDWMEIHVNRTKTRVVFVTMSPTHEKAEEWDGVPGRNCYGETEPVTKEGYRGSDWDPAIMQAVEVAMERLRKKGLLVEVLNITQLSEYRKEAHPTVYRRQWEPLTTSQLANPISFADCTHWCLPGVPDIWNQLLYASIFYE
ncbi:hypothetical protein MLD38_012226 [Melastoma candidum]|uniref:Uncharacterized protein n=1 Tax=Melastoma candidum TaxID=119954 RepID=A0ACB9R999_9MYRT|nr:hypothetical protein MLD38_012226 [Melastoma candidum]